VLLARIAESDAEQSARADSIEGVVCLPAGVAGVIALVEPCDYSLRRIGGHFISENDHEHCAAGSDWKMMFLYMTVVGVMCGLIALEKHVSATILVGLLLSTL